MYDSFRSDQPLSEYLRMKGADSALRESVLETALFLEDVLGLRLEDSDMTDDVLGNEAAIRSFVANRSRVAADDETHGV